MTRSKKPGELPLPAPPQAEHSILPFSSVAAVAVKGPAEAREFRPLSAAASRELERLIQQFHAADGEGRRLEILDHIDAQNYGKGLLDLARDIFGQGSEASTPALRARMLEMLAGNTSPEILPVLESVRDSAREDERVQAVLASARVRDRQLVGFVSHFFEDPGKEVRFSALEVVALQPREYREPLLVRAMHGPHADVALAGLAELELEATPATMPLLLQGLSAPNPEVREETLRSAGFLLDEEFESAAAATDWWEANRHRFDRNLIRIE